MNRAYVVRATWHYLNAHGRPTGRRSIQQFIQMVEGKTFSTPFIERWISNFVRVDEHGKLFLVAETVAVRCQSGGAPVAPVVEKTLQTQGSEGSPVAPQCQDGDPRTRGTIESESINSKLIAPSPPIGVERSEPATTANAKATKTRKSVAEKLHDVLADVTPLSKPKHASVPLGDPSQPEWVAKLRRDLAPLIHTPFCELSVDQRFTLARYHAWRWANCTQDPIHNRRRAAEIAAGITNLAGHHRWRLLDVSDYVNAADEVWAERGCTPWFKPWDVTGRFEVEPAVKRG